MVFSKSLDALYEIRQLRILTAETQSSQRFSVVFSAFSAALR